MRKFLLIAIVILALAAGAWYFLRPTGDDIPGANYIGRSPEECSRIQVLCVEGFERFDDASGCGCRPVR